MSDPAERAPARILDRMDALERPLPEPHEPGLEGPREAEHAAVSGALGSEVEARPGGTLRLVFRTAALALVIPVGYLLLLLTMLPLAPLPRVRVVWRSAFFRGWSRLALAIINLRVRVAGGAPRPPFLLVANHLSYLDILVLASALRCVFVSKLEVRSWPLMGRICHTMGTIFIDRTSRRDVTRVLAEMEQALARGLGVVLFPEGTSSRGATVEPFKSPLLALAARLGRPVHGAALGYRTLPGDPPAYRSLCWWGNTPFLPHALGVLRLHGGEASLDFAPQPIAEPDRKLLAERLRELVRAHFTPVAPE
jgi:1-acyl-sn-glycerol-3-phosphate acyltransferase